MQGTEIAGARIYGPGTTPAAIVGRRMPASRHRPDVSSRGLVQRARPFSFSFVSNTGDTDRRTKVRRPVQRGME